MSPLKPYFRHLVNMSYRSLLLLPVWYMDMDVFNVGHISRAGYNAFPFTHDLETGIGDIDNLFGAVREVSDKSRFAENVNYFAQMVERYWRSMYGPT